MKSPIATPEQRVKETEKNVQEEMWKFIAVTLKQGLKRLLESLLEDEIITKVKAKRYERSPGREGGLPRRPLLQGPGYPLRASGRPSGTPSGRKAHGFPAL
jgi:hypothetical protein